jgi:hypothetical protein
MKYKTLESVEQVAGLKVGDAIPMSYEGHQRNSVKIGYGVLLKQMASDVRFIFRLEDLSYRMIEIPDVSKGKIVDERYFIEKSRAKISKIGMLSREASKFEEALVA